MNTRIEHQILYRKNNCNQIATRKMDLGLGFRVFAIIGSEREGEEEIQTRRVMIVCAVVVMAERGADAEQNASPISTCCH